MESIEQKLSSMSVFNTLTDAELNHISGLFTCQNFSKGDTLISQKDQSKSVYFLYSGKVRAAMFSPSGKEVSYQELTHGQMFGEMSALDNQPRATHVIALEDGEVLILSQQNFHVLLDQYPAVAKATLLKLVELVRFLCDKLFEFSTLNVAGRVRAELLRLAKEKTAQTSGSVLLDNAPTHEELAGRLSTHREAITRELGQLQRRGLIHKERSKITIIDLELLAAADD